MVALMPAHRRLQTGSGRLNGLQFERHVGMPKPQEGCGSQRLDTVVWDWTKVFITELFYVVRKNEIVSDLRQ